MKKQESKVILFPQSIRNKDETGHDMNPRWKIRNPVELKKDEYNRYSGDPDRI